MNKLPELQTKLVGKSTLTTVSRHLRYRQDEVEFPSGARGLYTWVDDDYAAAATVPLDKRRGQTSVLLAWQERYPSQTVGWEIAAGAPDTDTGETQLEAAKRELLEEGGYEALYWELLGQQVENVGRGNSRSDVFVAAGMTAVGVRAQGDEAITNQRWFPLADVGGLMLDGQISSGHTMASIAMAQAFLRRHPEHPISQLVL